MRKIPYVSGCSYTNSVARGMPHVTCQLGVKAAYVFVSGAFNLKITAFVSVERIFTNNYFL